MVKINWFARNTGYAPAGEILIEVSGKSKNIIHICNVADIPAAYILIEGSGVSKHLEHIGNAAGAASGGVGRANIAGRPFAIFSTIYCAALGLTP